MKRLFIALCLLMSTLVSSAQISIDFGQVMATQNVTLKCLIRDSKTNDPLPFVTVYLIPQGDTTITHFAMSGL